MATYETDEEQLDAIKKWWKENGLSVIGGLVIGLGLLGGWRWWQFYSDQQAQIASGFYNQVLFSLEQDEIPQAEQAVSKLLSEHSGSPYSVLATLNMAHHDLEKGDIDSSHARLQWVIENSHLPELAHIARLRKARLFLSQGKVAEANSLIAGIDVGTFRGAYAEIRGDIAMAQGKIDEARNVYTEAVGHTDLSPQHSELVRMKLDDLGLKKEKRIEASVPTLEPSIDKTSSVPVDSSPTPLAIEPQLLPSLPETVLTPPVPVETESEESTEDTPATTELPSQPETVLTPPVPVETESEEEATEEKSKPDLAG